MRFITLLTVAGLLNVVEAADTYKVDPSHTTVGFSVSHLVINEVKGRFGEFDGHVVIDPKDGNTLVDTRATIQVKSVDTGIAARDEHLRNADFFHVEKFPIISFVSRRIENRDGRLFIHGMFTMHGVSKEIAVPVILRGPIKDPWGKTRLGIKIRTTLNRKDYGLTWNKVMETGGLVVGNEIEIEINAEAVKQEPSAATP